MVICPNCDGSGRMDVYINQYTLDDRDCTQCEGSGEIEEGVDDFVPERDAWTVND